MPKKTLSPEEKIELLEERIKTLEEKASFGKEKKPKKPRVDSMSDLHRSQKINDGLLYVFIFRPPIVIL